MANITYYFDGYSSSDWTNPSRMVDGSTSTKATTEDADDVQTNNSNTCAGTDLGPIAKVELRAFGRSPTTDPACYTHLQPIFSGGVGTYTNADLPSDEYGEWGSYINITSDSNAPSPWTWGAVQDLDCNVKSINKPVSTHDVYKVEIRVTYNFEKTVTETITTSDVTTKDTTREITETITSSDAITNDLTDGKIETFTDNFDDDSLDTNKWTDGSDPGATVTETGGQLELYCVGPESAATIVSNKSYDVTSSHMHVKVADAGTQSGYIGAIPLAGILTVGYYAFGWQIRNNNIEAIGLDTSTIYTHAYNADTYRWLKVRETGGTLYYDYSADGRSWTNAASFATSGYDLTKVLAYITVTAIFPELTSTLIIDNFNIAGQIVQTCSETSTITESIIKSSEHIIPEDTATGSDTVNSAISKFPLEDITISEVYSVDLGKLLVENITTTDSIENSHLPTAFVQECSESIVVSDTYSRDVWDIARSYVETVTTTDINSKNHTDWIRAYSDNVTVSDTTTRSSGRYRTLSDSISVSDSVKYNISWVLVLSETITASDLTFRSFSFNKLSDSIAVSDSVDYIRLNQLVLSENIQVSDTIAKKTEWLRQYVESINGIDNILIVGVRFITLTENVTLADVRIVGIDKVLSDTVTGVDYNPDTLQGRLMVDGISVSDIAQAWLKKRETTFTWSDVSTGGGLWTLVPTSEDKWI